MKKASIYNDLHVLYCNKCLSLTILEVDGENYCDNCGGCDIQISTIEEWDELYQKRYNNKFLNTKKHETRTNQRTTGKYL